MWRAKLLERMKVLEEWWLRTKSAFADLQLV